MDEEHSRLELGHLGQFVRRNGVQASGAFTLAGDDDLAGVATDAADTDNACAIAVLAAPSDAINNALARTTSRWAPDCDRATESSSSRCPAEISTAATGFLMTRFYAASGTSPGSGGPAGSFTLRGCVGR